MPGHETAFLIDTVGDALSKAVAATVAAQPADPVEHLAEWLLRYCSVCRTVLYWRQAMQWHKVLMLFCVIQVRAERAATGYPR